ncbi:DUF4212 domain-containing protein [Hydrogenophaga laconesensis]|uniref:Solute:sodium symporter small subunit n=1 Tax=Hydrogenophaga laconesensis TaxID=1805971 RepID=A0ABU1V9T5_9BURK|nr:DUF4212 domain-containing protein [Hydrogenophaga laconesensis]MDR7094221.1 putative solute:sodium symporter small subunit [Hydrogenophaga laconesensis]
MSERPTTDEHDRRALALKAVLLSVMVMVSFGVCFFARELSFVVMGWPVHFWMAAQGAVLVFIVIVVVYATVMSRLEAEDAAEQELEAGDG